MSTGSGAQPLTTSPQETPRGRPVGEHSAQVWDLEFLLTVTNNAFQRWAVRCMARSGEPGLTPLEVMVLHAVNKRAQNRTTSDLALLLNLDESHLITYAVKKLEARKLIKSQKKGKEKTISVTHKGASACYAYIETRERCLMHILRLSDVDDEELKSLEKVLRALSGAYDHAARAAISY